MKVPGASAKMSAAITAGLLFFIVSNPIVYKLVDSLLGGLVGSVASPSGCPTTVGLVLHSIVFVGVTYAVMGL